MLRKNPLLSNFDFNSIIYHNFDTYIQLAMFIKYWIEVQAKYLIGIFAWFQIQVLQVSVVVDSLLIVTPIV